ncbi:TPA: retron St85 family RNA-directed DNA polymerase [Vibrio alginolyticus]|uniref:retron St85 family RNA-directed DNA polymerase n=1 Tax=Vibrio alginolyticus TaxID=663 RepID=UPI0006CA9EF6|nr:retron St85 family RNA-directed DNA polymerase [Vibrio alginolyticus]MCS0404583.1 retron St85 family RNA-directed DNA polymerase [Vibrio diabolicus]ELB2752610.1 retron St85 family RNA-directed DNA polymerase [Vibrio alginolyticus]KPN01925.1 DNA polymerase [Vibrio alginolyticus]MBS9925531.1 retron St85 family RNA-directed DNA polymerase [Vibrio alginolyticus]WMO18444.1 retron St85 family RNA-directed DNA polymerase [Vibrio alginolyticus]
MNSIHKNQIASWNRFFDDRGISSHLTQQYIDYISNLICADLPIIFELEHLSKLTGINIDTLCKIIGDSSHFYRDFSIAKRRGGKRLISAPYPSLMTCQTWIYENILKKSPSHFCSHGYSPNKSIITNARPHLGNKAILKIDIRDFFPSISINWVIKYFSDLGYSNNVAYYLASICCLNKALPQGAPTSPALSNILLRGLDRRLYKLSKCYNLTYTRYADDLTFSGEHLPYKVISIISQIVSDYGLSVNEKKTSLIIGDKQKIVTGLSVRGDTLQLPRSSRREIKKEIYYIRKFGLLSHISKLKIRKTNYLDSLEGKLRFWLQIEPGNKFVQESLILILSIKN